MGRRGCRCREEREKGWMSPRGGGFCLSGSLRTLGHGPRTSQPSLPVLFPSPASPSTTTTVPVHNTIYPHSPVFSPLSPSTAVQMTSLLKNHPGTPARYDEPTAAPARVSSPPKTHTQSEPTEPRVVNAFRYAVPMPTRAELLKEPMLPDCELVGWLWS